MKGKIIDLLKNKYRNLGFTDKAFDGVAEFLSQTTTKEEEIETATDGVASLLKAFQSDADSRVTAAVEKTKKEATPTPPPPTPPTPPSGGDNGKQPADFTAAMQAALAPLMEKISALEAGKTVDHRLKAVEETLKDASPVFKAKALRDFPRMQFKDDAEFDTFLSEMKSDAEALTKQEQIAASAGRPFQAGGTAATKTVDADIAAWAAANNAK